MFPACGGLCHADSARELNIMFFGNSDDRTLRSYSMRLGLQNECTQVQCFRLNIAVISGANSPIKLMPMPMGTWVITA